MAYDHGRYSITLLGTGAALTGVNFTILASAAAADKARAIMGYQPHVIRAVWVQNLSTKAKVTKPVFDFRTATGGVASVSGGNFARLTLGTAGQAFGKINYRDGLNTEVQPGDTVAVAVKTAATVAFKVACGIYVEARWEKPANFTRMVSVTG
jgi:hypothetical protein